MTCKVMPSRVSTLTWVGKTISIKWVVWCVAVLGSVWAGSGAFAVGRYACMGLWTACAVVAGRFLVHSRLGLGIWHGNKKKRQKYITPVILRCLPRRAFFRDFAANSSQFTSYHRKKVPFFTLFWKKNIKNR